MTATFLIGYITVPDTTVYDISRRQWKKLWRKMLLLLFRCYRCHCHDSACLHHPGGSRFNFREVSFQKGIRKYGGKDGKGRGMREE